MGKLKVKRLIVSWFNEKIILDSVEIECRFKIILSVVSRKFGRCFFEEYILYRLYVIINNLVSGWWNVWFLYSRFNGNGCECYDVYIRVVIMILYLIFVFINSGCECFCIRCSYWKIFICIFVVLFCFFCFVFF